MEDLPTDQLTQLLARKLECLLELRKIGQEQQSLIESGEIETLLTLLTGKQRLLVRLQEIQRALDPFRGQPPETWQWEHAAQRETCAQLVAQCESLMAQVLEHERRGEREIVAQRDLAAQRLQMMNASQIAQHAYAMVPEVVSGQLDLSSEL